MASPSYHPTNSESSCDTTEWPRNTVDRSRWSKSTLNRYPKRVPQGSEDSLAQSQDEAPSTDKVADALRRNAKNSENNLIAPVHVPEDPHGIIKERHPATSLLANSSIVVQRQLEMMNVLMGFEQANRYVIMDAAGNHIGYLAEQEHGIGNTLYRQMAKTHRSFTTHVFDREEKEVLRFHRPFSWINSRIRVYDAVGNTGPTYSSSTALQNTSTGSLVHQTSAQVSQIPPDQMRLIGEAQQQWAPLRRKYNLFLHRDASTSEPPAGLPQTSTSRDLVRSPSSSSDPSIQGNDKAFIQFAQVNEPFLSWNFSLLSASSALLGSVNRNFAGFAREIFTDTGVYALRMDAAGLAAEPRHLISQTGSQNVATTTDLATTVQEEEEGLQKKTGMTLDQRAVMLAFAVSVDFDYFSRHSAGHGGFFPIWFPWGGEAAGEAGAAGAAAGAGAIMTDGVAGSAARGMAGRAAGAEGAAGAVGGAGTLAGYEAMQRGRGNAGEADDAFSNSEEEEDRKKQDGSPDVPQEQQGLSAEDSWGGQWPDRGGGGERGGGSGRGEGGGEGDWFGGGDGGGGGGGGDGDFFSDLF
ncbi:MAG: hypothetical protein Q9165_004931 [Trypethelium subeluteriae]